MTDAWASDQMRALGLSARALSHARVAPGEVTDADPRALRRGDAVLADGQWVRVRAGAEPAPDGHGHELTRVGVHRPDTGTEGYLMFAPGDTATVRRRAPGDGTVGASVRWPGRADAQARLDAIRSRLDYHPAASVASGVRPALARLRAQVAAPRPVPAAIEAGLGELSLMLRSGGQAGPAGDRQVAESFRELTDLVDSLRFLQDEASRAAGSGKYTKPAATGPKATIHHVKTGDTLSAIAEKHGVSVADLMKWNPHIKDPDKIFAGDTINVRKGGGAYDGNSSGGAEARKAKGQPGGGQWTKGGSPSGGGGPAKPAGGGGQRPAKPASGGHPMKPARPAGGGHPMKPAKPASGGRPMKPASRSVPAGVDPWVAEQMRALGLTPRG